MVALREPATESAILAFCRKHLADYKLPRRIDIRDELPRGASGKVVLPSDDLRW
jgi:acyl-CoA synthetase (AMP-forming)/AMP-acid ligase II